MRKEFILILVELIVFTAIMFTSSIYNYNVYLGSLNICMTMILLFTVYLTKIDIDKEKSINIYGDKK